MKTFIKLIFPIMAGVLLLYSSCRKVDNAPVKPTPNKVAGTDTLSGQIALNVAQSLAGNFGGVNLMDGVDSVSLSDHDGPHHGFNNKALCGFFTDSLVNFNCTKGDTISHSGGNLTFYFDCTDGRPSGYTAYDSLTTIKSTPKHVYQYTVKQYYKIRCLDDKHLFEGVDGDIYFYNSTTTFCGCHSSFTNIENANYVLKDLKVDLCHKDILSGTATFKAYGQGWSLIGSMTFLGNHKADVYVNGNVYHIDVWTGQILCCEVGH